jgi:hypothetical protein
MNQPDHDLATKIVGYLGEGARDIDASTAARLLAARKVALAHYQGERAPAWTWAWATQAAGRMVESRRSETLQMLIAVTILAAALIGGVYWQNHNSQANELAELDVGLLTDELPINAYLDKGFDSWLKRSSR